MIGWDYYVSINFEIKNTYIYIYIYIYIFLKIIFLTNANLINEYY
jgi:hypothetical protein